jgi:hypothetical protein
MTSVLLNRTGGDIVDLQVTQTGSGEATVVLKDPLLRGDKDYKFAVTEWSIPLQNIDMFGFLTTTQELFQIQRRVVRSTHTEHSAEQQTFDVAVLANNVDFAATATLIQTEEALRTVDGNPIFVDDQTDTLVERIDAIREALAGLFSVVPTPLFVPFSTHSLLRGRKFYDVNQFVKSLSDFARVFGEQLLKTGINEVHFGNTTYEDDDGNDQHDETLIDTDDETFDGFHDEQMLKISLTCDGNLMFIGHRFFWDNFIIRFTNFGAAILGMNTSQLTERTLVVTGDVVGAPFTGGVGPTIQAGNNNITVASRGAVSMFQASECRIKCALESHLPVQSGIEVRDEVETNNREIASAFFLNDVRVSTNWDASGSLNQYSLQSKVFVGQFPMIQSSGKIRQWNRLLTPYNLQFFRFFINVHWRYFSDVEGVWKVLIKRAVIDPADYWSMKIRFVSDE